MRHGEALAAAENPQRPLSPEGRRNVEAVARLALERNIQVSAIYHSGILRAKETADIVAGYLMPVGSAAELAGLLPEDDPSIIKGEIEADGDSILLVGHLPFMSRLAGLLVNGDPERPAVEFSPATLVCCIPAPSRWKIGWRLAP
jgi:phosphohistidine phosphatase